MLRRRRVLVGVSVAVVAICAGAVSWSRCASPPGYWPPERTLEERRRGWAKEKTWGAQQFTPIQDDESFLRAVAGAPVRIDTSLAPEPLNQLRRILYDQLVCRRLGSVECYRQRFVSGRQHPLDVDRRERVEKQHLKLFGKQPPERWDTEEVFEQFWSAEYADEQRHRRFESVALGPQGTLVAVGEVRTATPESFFSQEEIKRWKAWSGARLYRSLEFHVGAETLDLLIEKYGTCIYAEVAMLIRSENGEVWSWMTDWYIDPSTKRWQLQMSGVATLRDRYNVPM